MSSEEIKVSVCVVTYNHEKYIAECLQSLVEQETDFKFEIIVGDDASTDTTKEIILEFYNKYPDLVVPVFHKVNIGAVKNMLEVYRLAKGIYIAHLDGDDTALKGKLQVQADVLDDKDDCVMCTHNSYKINNDSEILSRGLNDKESGQYTLIDLYKDLPFFTHSTKMFRNDLSESYYDDLNDESIDIELHVAQCARGDIFHIKKPYGAYRVFTGVSSQNNKVNKLIVNANIRVYECALENGVQDLVRNDILRAYARAILNYSYQSLFFGDSRAARFYAKKSISIKFFSISQIALLTLSFFGFVSVPLIHIRNKIMNRCRGN